MFVIKPVQRTLVGEAAILLGVTAGSGTAASIGRFNGFFDASVMGSSISSPRANVGSGVLSNVAYMFGGTLISGGAQSSTISNYNGTSYSTNLAALGAARSTPAVTPLSSALYIFGGGSSAAATSAIQHFTPDTCSNDSATLSQSKTQCVAATLSSLAYVFGGSITGGTYSTRIETYDAATCSVFSTALPTPTVRDVAVLSGTVYNATWKFNGSILAATGMGWSGSGQMAVVNGKIYLLPSSSGAIQSSDGTTVSTTALSSSFASSSNNPACVFTQQAVLV